MMTTTLKLLERVDETRGGSFVTNFAKVNEYVDKCPKTDEQRVCNNIITPEFAFDKRCGGGFTVFTSLFNANSMPSAFNPDTRERICGSDAPPCNRLIRHKFNETCPDNSNIPQIVDSMRELRQVICHPSNAFSAVYSLSEVLVQKALSQSAHDRTICGFGIKMFFTVMDENNSALAWLTKTVRGQAFVENYGKIRDYIRRCPY